MKYLLLILGLLFYGCGSTQSSIVSTTKDSVSITYKTVYIPIEQQHYILGYYWQTPQWEHFMDTVNGATADIDRTNPTKPVAHITTPKDSAKVILPEVRHDVNTDTRHTIVKPLTFWQNFRISFANIFMPIVAIIMLLVGFRIVKPF